ncbi:replicative DNA helicase [Azospirillum argentinense]|uniref:DNA 5'-3' helicase n=1 Tax=Azospirillum argentinense TaxID=2970906 RepID=A0A2K1FXP1_9PROT|nr:DnaB-like helicase C-terminal domain-containing protein [Azospirillum argentinense]PNQ97304.1 replicative DNA helicase [Azospirillum argentinense]
MTTDATSLPHNEDIEQALLGALLFGGAYHRIAGALRPEHFYDEAHGEVFAVIAELAEAGRTVNPLTVCQALGEISLFTANGGTRAYLECLEGAYITPKAASDYAGVIRDLHQRRQLACMAEWLKAQALKPDLDRNAASLVAQAQSELDLLESGPSSRDTATMADVMNDAFAAIERAQVSVDGVSGIPSGLIDLDRATGGFQPSELIIIAGRPSMGKTVLATTACVNATLQGYVIRFNSLEMGTASLGQRLLAARSGVTMQDQRRRLALSQLAALEEARRYYIALPLAIDADSGLTVAQIRARARAHKRRHGLSMLVIDYLGLIVPDDPRMNKVHQVEEVTKALKATAKELEIPIVLLCQLSRQVEQREDKRPQLADLRDSGAIEQDADVVMFVYREHYYLSRCEPVRRPDEAQDKFNARYVDWQGREEASRNIGEVIIAKNRQGEIGHVRLRFDGCRQMFESLEDGR